MSHFYATKAKTPSLVEDVQTPAKAKKIPGMYPSVTTVLSIIVDDFINNIWKPRRITELAREYPDISWEDVIELTYGLRKHPKTGKMIPSSSFGVCVHKRIEELVDDVIHGGTNETVLDPFTPWAEPFLEWMDENDIKPKATEYIAVDHQLKIAGSIDFLGEDSDGKMFLADYKCRSTEDRGKFYDKDCQQLAVEANAIKKIFELDYLPECRSICISTDNKKHFHKVWKDKDVKKHLKTAQLAAKIYWNTRMQ